jgi:hypothetical protein
VCPQVCQRKFRRRAACTAAIYQPHRLFHGVRMPQWLEERPEVSEKAKKLYAYLTYFAGGKGYAWPTFNTLAERLHASRRHVIRLVKELSTHRLILITNVNHPERGSCANCYRSFGTPGCSHIRKYPTSSQNPVIQHQENQRWAQILASPQKLEEAQNHRMGSGRRPRPRNIPSRSTNSIRRVPACRGGRSQRAAAVDVREQCHGGDVVAIGELVTPWPPRHDG